MLYYTKEARESALNKLQDLRSKIASIPGDVLDYFDATATIRYLSDLSRMIEQEQRKADEISKSLKRTKEEMERNDER